MSGPDKYTVVTLSPDHTSATKREVYAYSVETEGNQIVFWRQGRALTLQADTVLEVRREDDEPKPDMAAQQDHLERIAAILLHASRGIGGEFPDWPDLFETGLTGRAAYGRLREAYDEIRDIVRPSSPVGDAAEAVPPASAVTDGDQSPGGTGSVANPSSPATATAGGQLRLCPHCSAHLQRAPAWRGSGWACIYHGIIDPPEKRS